MTPPFAFLDAPQGAFAELVRSLLLVAGGFLVGWVLGWALGWALGRWVFRMQNTAGLKALGRPVGGVLGALIVAMLVLTGRGKPLGEGGEGKGTTSTDPNAGKAGPPPEVDPKLPRKELPKPPETKPADVILTVTLYGGPKASGQQFYQFEGESGLRTLEGLQEAVLARRGREKGKVSLAVRYSADPNEQPGDQRVTTLLTDWARAQGLDVTFPAGK